MCTVLDPDTPYFRITSSAIKVWVPWDTYIINALLCFWKSKTPDIKECHQNENKYTIETPHHEGGHNQESCLINGI